MSPSQLNQCRDDYKEEAIVSPSQLNQWRDNLLHAAALSCYRTSFPIVVGRVCTERRDTKNETFAHTA